MNVAERGQTIQSGINPAIQRHIRRPHVPRLADGLRFLTLAEGSPFRDIRSGVMGVGAENLPTRIPSKNATYQHVRCEVLLPRKPSGAYPSSQAVGQ